MNLCIDTDGPMAQSLLDDNHELIQYYLLNYTPLIFINNHLYKGNLIDTLHLVESLCMAFEDPPKECTDLDIFNEYNNFSGSSLLSFILTTLFYLGTLFLVVVVVFYCFYKRKMKRKMNAELSDKVNEAMMKYYGASQTSQKYEGIKVENINDSMTPNERKIAIENSLTDNVNS
jgi:hypothetical protein